AVSCQREIIALSIRNRAQTKKFSSFGHKYIGDFTGAASTDHQYNAWFENLVQYKNYRITSCFHSDKSGYISSRAQKDSTYLVFKDRYDKIVERLPLVL